MKLTGPVCAEAMNGDEEGLGPWGLVGLVCDVSGGEHGDDLGRNGQARIFFHRQTGFLMA